MNRKQTIALWVSIFVFLLLGLFPPWVYPLISRYSPGGLYLGVGSHFILTPPKMEDIRSQEMWVKMTGISSICRIDVPRLMSQWIMVAVVTGGLIVTLKDKKKN